MSRLIAPLVFAVFFVAWLIYHAFIAKDLRKHTNELFFGIFFFGVWALIYWAVFS